MLSARVFDGSKDAKAVFKDLPDENDDVLSSSRRSVIKFSQFFLDI